MRIIINEQSTVINEKLTLGDIACRYKVDADVLILNGFPSDKKCVLKDGDEIFLIRRGEIPTEIEMESLMASRHTPGVHALMKHASVGIAGIGGLGSSVAVALARVGIGRLVIADFDVVEPSNLNRQQYFTDQIGLFKVDALTCNLRRINPFITVESHCLRLGPENIPGIFSGCGIIVEAFDRADMKAMLVNQVLESMPASTVIASSGLAGFANNNSIMTRKVSQRLYLVGDGVSEAMAGNGLMAPRVGIAAHHQANQVVRLIMGEDS